MNVKTPSLLALLASVVPLAPALAATDILEEITVTATRRAESVQNIANAASVFSSEELNSLHIEAPRDLAEQTPGLLTKFGPNGLATVGFYLRGVGINDFTGTVDPSVGVYVDEVFMPTPDMLNFAVFDTDRIEILKGPQGTLYGRNSTGGAVNFIVAKPTRDVEGNLRAGYANYHNSSLSGAISGPLSDTLLGRLSFSGQNIPSGQGYSYNTFTKTTLGRKDQIAVRGQLQWLPTDTFNVRLMWGYGRESASLPLLQHVSARDPANRGNVCAPVIAGHRSEGACVDLLGYYDTNTNPYNGAAGLNPALYLKSNDLTATIEWQLPGFKLTSISGYDNFSKRQSQDIDATPAVIADNHTFNHVTNYSEEIRLTSDDSASIPWIVGANYGKTDIDWFQNIDLSAIAIPTSNGAVQQTKAWALFGQLTFRLADQLHLVTGLRYTDEKRSWAGATFVGTFSDLNAAYAANAPELSVLPIPVGNPGQGGPLDFPTQLEAKKLNYLAALKYNPTVDALLYLTVSDAFRSGGYSSAVIFSQAALKPYVPETLRSYEAGLKYSLLDKRLRVNTSAYYYDYKNFQATFVRGTEASARLQNVGDVHIKGLEASVDWLPVTGLTISGGLNVMNSEIVRTEVVLAPLNGGPATSIQGNELPNSPKLTLNGRIRYETPVSSRLNMTFQTDFNKISSHFLEPNNRQYLAEAGYFLINGRVSLMSKGGHWDASLWIRNAADKVYRSAAQDLALALGFSEIVLGQPRTYGVEFGYKF